MRRLRFIEGRPPVIQTEKMDPTIGTNFKEVWVLITLKVDLGSYSRFAVSKEVKRGDFLGLSPHFDDQIVLSPIDGIIERITCDPEQQAVLISIRRQRMQWQAAHS
jgi:hypothetical protein